MKTISSNNLVPGMVLAKSVSTPESNRLLEKGTILSNRDIAKLVFYSIPEVSIEEDEIDQIISESPSSEGLSFNERLKQSQEFKEFKKDFEECATKLQQGTEDILNGSPINPQKMLEPIYALLKKGKTTSDVFEMLHNLRDYDDATYTHSINVSLSTNILAQWLKWNEEEIETATLSGLFHDIGKLTIPDSIITKPDKLTQEEYQLIRTHAQKGYDVLRNLDISDHIKNAALMHHERCDGTGYPLGLKGPQIDKYAKIVSITDVYDAITSARHYRKPLCPFIAISMFEDEGFQRYDAEMILCFLENIVNTYLLNTVRLSTGETGEIVFINRTSLSRPTVKIGNDYVDLSKCPGVYIQDLL
ncbi:MAG: HD-GYP domain-containing protein [Butyrivibrio sp.]|nr:HD-GYP domain-containing protein [Butyrivibrio sp.]